MKSHAGISMLLSRVSSKSYAAFIQPLLALTLVVWLALSIFASGCGHDPDRAERGKKDVGERQMDSAERELVGPR